MNRIITTHVGSLIRPPELVKYLRAIEDGIEVDMKAYDACLKESVIDVVRQQREAGIDIVSDGEFGKAKQGSDQRKKMIFLSKSSQSRIV
jgi:5-methyltetrahydropteroyltriglutamate--homocysteine methyltransferase